MPADPSYHVLDLSACTALQSVHIEVSLCGGVRSNAECGIEFEYMVNVVNTMSSSIQAVEFFTKDMGYPISHWQVRWGWVDDTICDIPNLSRVVFRLPVSSDRKEELAKRMVPQAEDFIHQVLPRSRKRDLLYFV